MMCNFRVIKENLKQQSLLQDASANTVDLWLLQYSPLVQCPNLLQLERLFSDYEIEILCIHSDRLKYVGSVAGYPHGTQNDLRLRKIVFSCSASSFENNFNSYGIQTAVFECPVKRDIYLWLAECETVKSIIFCFDPSTDTLNLLKDKTVSIIQTDECDQMQIHKGCLMYRFGGAKLPNNIILIEQFEPAYVEFNGKKFSRTEFKTKLQTSFPENSCDKQQQTHTLQQSDLRTNQCVQSFQTDILLDLVTLLLLILILKQ